MKKFVAVTVAALAAVTGLAIAGEPSKPAGASASAPKDIIDTAVGAGSFKTLATLLTGAELVDALKGKGPFTVFAPTDEAFAKLPSELVADLQKPENKAKLQAILKYHVVPGAVMAADVVKLSESPKTHQGQSFKIKTKDGKVMIGSDDKAMATVVKTDIACSNGVIHVIDTVILPPAGAPAGH